MNSVGAYRWQLSEALQSSSDPGTLYGAVVRLLGKYLGVQRVMHVYGDNGDIVVDHEYVDDATSLIGRVAAAPFSPVTREMMFEGRTRVITDTASAPYLLAYDREYLASVRVRSYVKVSLGQSWDVAGGFAIHSAEPRVWTPVELELMVETADRTWDAVKRAIAERELRAAAHRDRYRLKLTDALRNLDEEPAIVHAAVHALGEHLHVNRVYYADIADQVATIHPEYLDGVESIVGKIKLSAWATGHVTQLGNAFVIDDVEKEPRLSESERTAYLERQTCAVIAVNILRADSWIASLVVSRREPRPWTVEEVSLVEDTAQRMWSAIARLRGELQLREAAARDALRLCLADTVRLSTDVGELRAQALRLLGEHLKADRLILMERDGNEFVAYGDYSAALPPIPGRYAFSDFPSASSALRRGEAVVISDLATDPKISEDTRTNCAALGIEALLGVPLFRGGELVAALSIHMGKPRQWREDEVALMRDAGERMWSAIERLHDERALHETETALREAARNKDAFLAMLAHELRNPLAPLHTSVELLYRAVEDPRMLIEITAIMERQLRHMTRLVDDLLDAARISHGSIRIERAPAPLARILDEAADMHARACKDRHITLTKTVDRSVTVDVDHVRLVQVLSNLLHNAVKFTDPGGRIDVHAHVYGNNVNITVEDTGVGIEPELMPVVFELFHRAGDERSGLGVGLALCRQLVELHGGTIGARPRTEGRGTVFEIRLPDSVTQAMVQENTPVPMRSVATRTDILLVDDNVDIVRATSILINVLGAKPHVATDGASALALATKIRPAAVLLDIGMPGLDGYEVCRQLRATFGSEIRLVAYTGWGKPEDKRRALEAGFDVHITKPADVNTLARALLLKP